MSQTTGEFGATGRRLYSALVARLLDTAEAPDALLLETAIAADFGVSRTPVKEALIRLEQDGYIERAGRGFRRRTAGQQEILDLYETRGILEAGVASAAAVRSSDLDIARLERLTALHEQSTDPRDADEYRVLFHDALAESSHNGTLRRLLEDVITRIRLFDTSTEIPQTDAAEALDEHRAILSAVRAHDDRAARELMLEHVGKTRRRRLLVFADWTIDATTGGGGGSARAAR